MCISYYSYHFLCLFACLFSVRYLLFILFFVALEKNPFHLLIHMSIKWIMFGWLTIPCCNAKTLTSNMPLHFTLTLFIHCRMYPSINAFHCYLSNDFLLLVVPSFFAMSSYQLLLDYPLDLLSLFGCHSVQHLVHMLSFILAVSSVHFHCCFSVYSIMSAIFVLFMISEHGTLSCSFKSKIFLSIALCLSVVC